MPKPILICANRKDVAPRVITVGDPKRTEQLAALLSGAKVVSNSRGYLTCTGHYKDKLITIATHGIGGPSAAIVFEELRMLGAKSVVRLGTSGAMIRSLKRGDFIIPTGAAHAGGSLAEYVSDGVLPPVPNFGLTSRLIEGCVAGHLRFRAGLIFTTDAFYGENQNFLRNWAARGVIGVDMECATLFTLGSIRGFKTASLLIVSDNLAVKKEKEILGAKELKNSVEKAGKLVLAALVAEPT
jgi:5'-methylthioadenosine phosphorylase